MTSLKQVAEDIRTISDVEKSELKGEIVAAFGDYEYAGVNDIIVSSNQAYANVQDAPIIRFETIENEDGTISVTDAWIA